VLRRCVSDAGLQGARAAPGEAPRCRQKNRRVWLRGNGEGRGLNLSARYATEALALALALALSSGGALARTGNLDGAGDFKPATLDDAGRRARRTRRRGAGGI
jgi:hypothetical protein